MLAPPAVASPEARVDAKAWFSAERTFVAWMHSSLIAAGASFGLIAVGQTNLNRASGLMLLLPATFLAGWGAYMYRVRCNALNRASARGLRDPIGPAIAVSLLTLTAVVNSYMGIRAYLALPRAT